MIKKAGPRSITADGREHIRNLLKWSAKAAARGDMEASDRLRFMAHRVLMRAVAEQDKS